MRARFLLRLATGACAGIVGPVLVAALLASPAEATVTRQTSLSATRSSLMVTHSFAAGARVGVSWTQLSKGSSEFSGLP